MAVTTPRPNVHAGLQPREIRTVLVVTGPGCRRNVRHEHISATVFAWNVAGRNIQADFVSQWYPPGTPAGLCASGFGSLKRLAALVFGLGLGNDYLVKALIGPRRGLRGRLMNDPNHPENQFETMAPTAPAGEIMKRSLDGGDKAGIKFIYGAL